MTQRLSISFQDLLRNERGGVTIEFSIVAIMFFLLFFSALDYGRLTYSQTMAQNAANIAARIAIVRSPACAGVPERHSRGSASPAPRFGTSCKAQSGTCETVATVACVGSASSATASEIWTRVQPLLPLGTVIADLQFTYQFDENLGYLGGPFTPMVTVDLNLPDFQFASPLGSLAAAASGSATPTVGTTATFGRFSVSLPGEDLALGADG